MGQLDRYKKPGGFRQLLSLIESFAPQKQEKFLNIVDLENPTWGGALRAKMLTIPRILAWPSATLAEIVPKMNVNILGIALHGLKPEEIERFLGGLPGGERRRINSEFETAKPQAHEIAITHVKLIEAVRRMITDGELRLEVVDPGTIITEKVEEALLQSSTFVRGEMDPLELASEAAAADKTKELVSEAIKEVTVGSRQVGDGKIATEMKSLQALILSIQKENKALKGEVKILKDRLEAIRKIA